MASANPPTSPSSRSPTDEDYRLLIRQAWKDVHHSRNQEWKALVAITGAHLVILQVVNLSREVLTHMLHPTIIGGAVIGVLSALTGICITARARRLLEIKTQWIYRAEEKLGLVESRAYADGELADDTETGIIPRDDTKAEHLSWDGLLRSRRFSTSFLLTLLYLLLVITDLWVAFLFFRMS